MHVWRDRTRLIRRICECKDLRTYDPYDIWKTSLGFRTKDFYNNHRVLGLPMATLLTLFDMYINGSKRLFYQRQEYPIVRAMAALSLLKLFSQHQDEALLSFVRRHLDWLCQNSCTGFSGPCWGLGFPYAVDKGLVYDVNTPLTTMTPYALEAFVEYLRLTGDQTWLPTIRGVFQFLERDVQILEETEDYLVTSYSNLRDRTVVNAVSYVMYSYALLYPYVDAVQREMLVGKIKKLYNFIRRNQDPDGSWLYSLQSASFIDCFHSCIVIKNIIKTARVIDLVDHREVSSRGYQYLKKNMFTKESGLVRRFAKTNKPGIIRYDLYDNAEMLNLALLMDDQELARILDSNIESTFVQGERIYSHVDWLGIRRGQDMLRWAVMPYIYALATPDWDVAK